MLKVVLPGEGERSHIYGIECIALETIHESFSMVIVIIVVRMEATLFPTLYPK